MIFNKAFDTMRWMKYMLATIFGTLEFKDGLDLKLPGAQNHNASCTSIYIYGCVFL